MKRFLSAVLVLALCLTLLPAPALAAEDTQTEPIRSSPSDGRLYSGCT